MPSIPARCRACGYIWQPSSGIYVGGNSSVALRGNITNCPRCGGLADFIDGSIEVTPDGALSLISGPQWSADVIDQLRLGIYRILEEEPADPLGELAKIDPAAAEAVDQTVDFLKEKQPRTTRRRLALKVMAFLASTVFSAGVGVALDRATDGDPVEQVTPEQIQREFDAQLKEIQRTKRVPRPPR